MKDARLGHKLLFRRVCPVVHSTVGNACVCLFLCALATAAKTFIKMQFSFAIYQVISIILKRALKSMLHLMEWPGTCNALPEKMNDGFVASHKDLIWVQITFSRSFYPRILMTLKLPFNHMCLGRRRSNKMLPRTKQEVARLLLRHHVAFYLRDASATPANGKWQMAN